MSIGVHRLVPIIVIPNFVNTFVFSFIYAQYTKIMEKDYKHLHKFDWFYFDICLHDSKTWNRATVNIHVCEVCASYCFLTFYILESRSLIKWEFSPFFSFFLCSTRIWSHHHLQLRQSHNSFVCYTMLGWHLFGRNDFCKDRKTIWWPWNRLFLNLQLFFFNLLLSFRECKARNP